MRVTWDVFCNVIDNYGDIGVAWRLARDLARAPQRSVRLWVDDLAAFQRIWPAVDVDAAEQACEAVTVRAWRTPFPESAPAQVVIEAFGCALPEAYLNAMARRSPAPVWINLEYMSAEAWVEAHHGLQSPHPRLPLTKHFFFPGYSLRTGGLLIESALPARRDAFQRQERGTFWSALGLPAPRPGEMRVSLFGYENPALPALLEAWRADVQAVTCLVPEGRVLPQLAAWLGQPALRAGDVASRGALRLHVLPFTDQDSYDRLLWACDLNFVRGEDSCVRAQAAARPLVWQAYPQAERVHWDKLEALLERYVAGLDDAASQAVCALWRGWNGVGGMAPLAESWAGWRRHWGTLEVHARGWAAHLLTLPRLTDALADFAETKLK